MSPISITTKNSIQTNTSNRLCQLVWHQRILDSCGWKGGYPWTYLIVDFWKWIKDFDHVTCIGFTKCLCCKKALGHFFSRAPLFYYINPISYMHSMHIYLIERKKTLLLVQKGYTKGYAEGEHGKTNTVNSLILSLSIVGPSLENGFGMA